MDDKTIGLYFPVSQTANVQASANCIAQDVNENMRLNPTKSKERNICFKRENLHLSNTVLGDKDLRFKYLRRPNMEL